MLKYFALALIMYASAQIAAARSFRFALAQEIGNGDFTVKHVPSAPTTVKFSVDQIVLGITASAFDKSYDLNSETMKQTIASCMVGVLPEDIDKLEVDGRYSPFATTVSSDDATDKRIYDHRKQASVLPQEEKLLMRYTVHVHSEYSKEALLNQLTIATTGATFESNLQIFATENGAVDLLCVEVGMSVESASLERHLLEFDDASGSDVKTTSFGFAFVCLGAVCFVVLMCGLRYAPFSYAHDDQKNFTISIF